VPTKPVDGGSLLGGVCCRKLEVDSAVLVGEQFDVTYLGSPNPVGEEAQLDVVVDLVSDDLVRTSVRKISRCGGCPLECFRFGEGSSSYRLTVCLHQRGDHAPLIRIREKTGRSAPERPDDAPALQLDGPVNEFPGAYELVHLATLGLSVVGIAADDKLSVMTDHHATSEAEEMYIITVARAVEDGVGPPVPLSTISGVLEVSSVSANQMIKKLESVGLVAYTPYKGVTLTAAGDELANTVLRNRRLWGRFLADHLGLTPAKADEVACEMEHVTPEMVAVRLASFLGDPTTGPTGMPIPGRSEPERLASTPLTDIDVGEPATVVAVGTNSESFLRSQGIVEGAELTVLGTGESFSVLLEGPSGSVHLSGVVAEEILVRR